MDETQHPSEENPSSRFGIYAKCSHEIVSASDVVFVDAIINGPIEELTTSIPQIEVVSPAGETVNKSSMIAKGVRGEDGQSFIGQVNVGKAFSPGTYEVLVSVPGEAAAYVMLLQVVKHSFSPDIEMLNSALTKRTVAIEAFERQDFVNAGVILKEAAELYQKLNLKQDAAEVYGDLSSICLKEEKYEDADVLVRRALELNEDVGDKRAVAICYSRLGKIQEASGKTNSAMKHYETAADLHQKLNVSNLALLDYHSLYDLALASKNFGKALRYYGKALDLALSLLDTQHRTEALYFLAHTRPPDEQELKSIGLFHTLVKKITTPYVDVDSVIQDSIADYKRARVLEKAIDINFVSPRERIRTNIDRTRLKGLISHLLENLTSQSLRQDPITIRTELVGDQFSVEVKDVDLEPPEESRDKIFEALAGLKSNEGVVLGTGLGLSAVKNIVLAHGGRISVNPEAGKITDFYFTLPIKSTL